MDPQYEIEKGLVKAQLQAAKETAEMKAALYTKGHSYIVSTRDIRLGEAKFARDAEAAFTDKRKDNVGVHHPGARVHVRYTNTSAQHNATHAGTRRQKMT